MDKVMTAKEICSKNHCHIVAEIFIGLQNTDLPSSVIAVIFPVSKHRKEPIINIHHPIYDVEALINVLQISNVRLEATA